MSYFLDVPKDKIETVNDIVKSRTDAVPYDSYPHPENSDFHRMQYENEELRNEAYEEIKSFEIEAYKWEGTLTSSGIFLSSS